MDSNADARVITSEQFIIDQLHAMRTDFTSALSDFATQSDLDTMVDKVADRAFQRFSGAIDDLKASQERFQNEQRDKVDGFITEVRAKLDTLAPIEKVEALRTTVESNYREFTGAVASLTADVTNLKDQHQRYEKKTDENIGSIKASTKNIDDRTNVIQNSVMQFIDASKEHQAATRSRIDGVEDVLKSQKQDIEKLEGRVDTETTIVRDVDTRVQAGMTRIDNALYGDAKEKKPGLIADMTTLKAGLGWQSWIGHHLKTSFLIAGALYVVFLIFTAFILGRPEIVAQMIPVNSGRPN